MFDLPADFHQVKRSLAGTQTEVNDMPSISHLLPCSITTDCAAYKKIWAVVSSASITPRAKPPTAPARAICLGGTHMTHLPALSSDCALLLTSHQSRKPILHGGVALLRCLQERPSKAHEAFACFSTSNCGQAQQSSTTQ